MNKKKSAQFISLSIILITLISCSSSKELTANDIVDSFTSAGLEAVQPESMKKDDYGFAPYVCEGTHFFIPSLCEDCGGRIFLCDTDEDLEHLKNYYEELGRISAVFSSWVFTKDNVLIQINGDLAEDIAKKYEEAIPSAIMQTNNALAPTESNNQITDAMIQTAIAETQSLKNSQEIESSNVPQNNLTPLPKPTNTEVDKEGSQEIQNENLVGYTGDFLNNEIVAVRIYNIEYPSNYESTEIRSTS